MDRRTALQSGYELYLGELGLRIENCLGRGSNAIVYRAAYEDASMPGQLHHTLVKELFPWRPDGGIYRERSGAVRCDPEAEKFFDLHRESFLRGNKIHLDMQRSRADKVPLNWNTYPANGTLYTISGDSGGRTLREILQTGEELSLETISCWMSSLLYSLRVFHEQRLLHLDISPDNILLQPLDQGKPESMREVLLIDYNSAWNQTELTQREEIFLSLKEPYSSPEVRLKVLDTIGVPSDLYSVCVVFLTCLLGAPPAQESLKRCMPALKTAPALRKVPSTAVHQTVSILRRGLKAPPRQRYQTSDEAIEAFSELLARIRGGGMTRAALWEASTQGFRTARACMPAGAELEELAVLKRTDLEELQRGGSCILTGGGGTGKTSALMGLWMEGTRSYNSKTPIPIFLPLYAYDGKENYLQRTLLGLLRLSQGENTESADRSLTQFLNGPQLNVRLLLDGMDEAAGDIRPLYREIRVLCRRPGVEIIAAARYMAPELGLRERPMPKLTDEEITGYLARRKLAPPCGEGVRELLRTPVFLNMYGHLCPQEELQDGDEEALLSSYLDSLVDACRKNDGEDAGYRGEFAVFVLLPLLAGKMNGRPRLSSDAVYQCAARCYALLGRRTFRKAFPRYVGRVEALRGGAADPEAWFARMIRELLERRFALLWQDDEGEYHLFHQYFQPLLAKRWSRHQSRIRRARLSGCWSLIPAAALCAALIVGAVRRTPQAGAYPRTSQEQRTAELAVNELVLACGLLDDQYQAERSILDAVDEALYGGGAEAWETWRQYKERQLTTVRSIGMDNVLPGELLLQLEDAPVPLEAIERLYSLPVVHRDALYERLDLLERCLAPDSGYPESDRRQMTRLFSLLLESETAESFLLIGQIVSALDEDTASPVMELLSFTGSWRAQLRQVDWKGTDYEMGLAACQADQKEIKLDLAALGMSL